MGIGQNIRKRRKELGLSLEDVAKGVGVSRQTLSRYETGRIRNIPSDRIESLARELKTTPDVLMGWGGNANPPPNIVAMPKTYKVPLLGEIACGEPILSIEEAKDFIDVPKRIKADFALLCKGDSMINARIFDGDIVYIKQQPMVENGEIAAVVVNDEATLKRVHLYGDHISLDPENPKYKPIILYGEDVNTVQILGLAVGFFCEINYNQDSEGEL